MLIEPFGPFHERVEIAIHQLDVVFVAARREIGRVEGERMIDLEPARADGADNVGDGVRTRE